MKSSFDVKGKIALVTGANRGIGKAIVESLVEHGAEKVYAGVRSMETAAPLVNELGSKIVPIELDISKTAQVQAAAGIATDVELVVNNAGVLRVSGPLAEDFEENFSFEVDVNVYGVLRMAKAFAPVLKANGGGVFAQVNSVASFQSFPDFASYCASKAASYSVTLALREKLAEQGTSVLSVHPGPIATDMAHGVGLGDIAEPASLVGEELVNSLKQGSFHSFPDTLAKEIGGAYRNFAEKVVLAEG